MEEALKTYIQAEQQADLVKREIYHAVSILNRYDLLTRKERRYIMNRAEKTIKRELTRACL